MSQNVDIALPKLAELEFHLDRMACRLKEYPTATVIGELYSEFDDKWLDAFTECSRTGIPFSTFLAFLVSDSVGNPVRQSFSPASSNQWHIAAMQLQVVSKSVNQFRANVPKVESTPSAETIALHTLIGKLDVTFNTLCRYSDADDAEEPYRNIELITSLYELLITRCREARKAAGISMLLPLLEKARWPNPNEWYHKLHADLSPDFDLLQENGRLRLRHALGVYNLDLNRLEAMVYSPAEKRLNVTSFSNGAIPGYAGFISYSHKDERLKNRLVTHLSQLHNEGLIDTWHDRKIMPGSDWKGEIDSHLDSATIVLILVSPDFLASRYCYDLEMMRALKRHEDKQAIVVPVVLRSCDWGTTPLASLQALPKDAKPVTDWSNRDRAFTDIASGIRKLIHEIRTK